LANNQSIFGQGLGLDAVASIAYGLAMLFAALPEPPYYIVAFSSIRTEGDHGYAAMADAMAALASQQPGYLGVETVRGADGFGITNSFWRDEASLIAWKAIAQHLLAQKLGKERWYQHYALRVARVERAYTGPDGRLSSD
jgi:heme-degrading monooxygenase HmoA